MDKAKVFMNGRSQAVRLPLNYRFDSDEVMINRIGGIVMLMSKDDNWSDVFGALDMFSDDFMEGGRENMVFTEREDL